MLLLRTGSFGDAVPVSPLAAFFKEVTSALEAMGRQLSRFEKLLWPSISVYFGIPGSSAVVLGSIFICRCISVEAAARGSPATSPADYLGSILFSFQSALLPD